MARKTKEEAEKTRERILASALSLFAEKGYEHTTLTDVADRLDLTKGAVYWYFESKEAVLSELVKLALAKFSRQILSLMPEGELSFPLVSDMMVKNAEEVVSDPRGAAFFRLMRCQIEWGSDSMKSVRMDLLTNDLFGPKQAFQKAISNDIAAGRVIATADASEISDVCIAIWDGLVQQRLDHFLTCDLKKTLSDAYRAIWLDIRVK